MATLSSSHATSAAITTSAVSGRDAYRSARDSGRLSGDRSRSTDGSGRDMPTPKRLVKQVRRQVTLIQHRLPPATVTAYERSTKIAPRVARYRYGSPAPSCPAQAESLSRGIVNLSTEVSRWVETPPGCCGRRAELLVKVELMTPLMPGSRGSGSAPGTASTASAHPASATAAVRERYAVRQPAVSAACLRGQRHWLLSPGDSTEQAANLSGLPPVSRTGLPARTLRGRMRR
jgi:hypothetical protein